LLESVADDAMVSSFPPDLKPMAVLIFRAGGAGFVRGGALKQPIF
jgi:hypothetical protein